MAVEAFLADRLLGMRLAGTIFPNCLRRRVLSVVVAMTIAIPVVAAIPMVAQAAVGTANAPSDSTRYRRCLADSGVNPAAALADAEGWIKSGGGVPAEHCAALTLITLKRYAEAAVRLDRIAGGRATLNAEFRVALFDQAGNAWLLAGDGARAVQSFTGALALSAGDADLFADLARAQAMRRDWHEVDLDLNAALQLSPRRADLLVLRASARRALKRYEDSRADIEAALKLKPGDGSALVERGLLRRQLGDIGGARRDFEAALKTGSGNVAAEAKTNLEDLTP
jgi:tetratricopeptide (TPR) repeat protein